MLPSDLTGSYKCYKEGTLIFTTWLHNNAEKCGYKAPADPNFNKTPAKSTRPKGKAKQQAKKEAKEQQQGNGTTESPRLNATVQPTRKVTTREFLAQATLVANSRKPRIKVPVAIIQRVQRTIVARKRCAEWFEQDSADKTPGLESEIAKHRHFIGILEQAVEILLPCVEKTRRAKRPADTKTESDLANRFEALEIQGVGDDDLNVMVDDPIVVGQESAVGRDDKSSRPEVFDVEQENSADLQFMIFCFFEDQHRMLDFVKETWEKVTADQLGDMEAALITNMVVELIQKAEDDLIELNPTRITKKTAYIDMCFLLANGSHERIQPAYPPQQIVAHNNFLFGSVLITLNKYQRPKLRIKELGPWANIESAEQYRQRRPAAVPLDPAWEHEDKFLTQMLLDLEFSRPYSGNPEALRFQDAITRTLRYCQVTGNITAGVVFAGRVLLSIHAVMGSKSEEVYSLLRHRAQSVTDMQDMTISKPTLPGQGSTSFTSKWSERGLSAMHEMSVHLFTWIDSIIRLDTLMLDKYGALLQSDDVLPQNRRVKLDQNVDIILGRTKLPFTLDQIDQVCVFNSSQYRLPFVEDGEEDSQVQKYEEHELGCITASLDAAFYNKNQPVYTGMQSLQLLEKFERQGVCTDYTLYSFIPFAHLYNAINKQENMMSKNWKQLEETIKTHLSQAFIGGRLPETPKEMYQRYCLATGSSLANIVAKSNRKPQPKMVRMRCIERTEISQYLTRYFAGDPDLSTERLLFDLERQRGKRKSATKDTIQHLELLTNLRDWISDPISRMKTDWMDLSNRCYDRLDFIRRCLSQHHLEFADKYEATGIDPTEAHVRMVELILGESYHSKKFFKDLREQKTRPSDTAHNYPLGGDEIWKYNSVLQFAGLTINHFDAKNDPHYDEPFNFGLKVPESASFEKAYDPKAAWLFRQTVFGAVDVLGGEMDQHKGSLDRREQISFEVTDYIRGHLGD